jgi:hypothetical protein
MAETAWSKWFLVFVEAKKRDTADLLALQWDPGAAAGSTFSVPLSPTGQEPATYYGASTAATATMRDGITTALSVLSWAALYWTDQVYAEPVAVWSGPDGWRFEGPPGYVYAAWLAALADMGLQRIAPDQV